MAAERRSPVPLIVAALVGILLIVVVRTVLGGGDDPGGSAATDSGDPRPADPSCTQLQVAASSEKAALLSGLAQAYNASNPSVNGTCVQVAVASKASGGAADALARGWDETVDGPKPDVWTPASSSWTVLLRQATAQLDRPDLVPKKLPSVAQTPLVLAMPRPMAEALGWPAKALGWTDLVALAKDPQGWGTRGHPEWGRFKLGKTNPHFSTSGLNATIGAYFAATGRSNDLSVKDVADPTVTAFVKRLESTVVHYGDTTLTFLTNMARAAADGQGLTYVSAVTVEEKSVLDYNRGNPTGDPATEAGATPPAVPLAAIYPKEGTLLSDNPWVVLQAEWVTDAKRTAAADFLAFVQRPESQQEFQQAGFRTFEGKPGDVIDPANGMLPTQPAVVLAPPAPPVLQKVQDSWDSLRKRARVLMVMDVSGSMGEAVPDSGDTKLELAKQAATSAVQGFAPDDEVGLWAFSTQLGSAGEPWTPLVPIRPARSSVPAITKAVANLVPDGGTGLYATLRAAHRQMLADLNTDRINAIVLLTDGRNEYPVDTDLNGLLRQLSGESLDTSVRVFSIGYGDSADRASLESIAQASRAAYYDASDPASIGKVLVSVLSNF